MADINEKLNQTEQVTKSIEKTLENIVKLETEINTKTSRITPELIGEEQAKEEERTLTQLRQAVKEYKEELNSIKSVEVNSNTADALAGRVDRLNAKMEVTKKTIKEIYEMAANAVVGHFDTSSGKGIKYDLNQSVSRGAMAYVDVNNGTDKQRLLNARNIAAEADAKISDGLIPELEGIINKFKDFRYKTEKEISSLSKDDKKKYDDAKSKYEEALKFVNNKYAEENLKIFTDQVKGTFSSNELALSKITYFDKANTIFDSVDTDTLGFAINNALESKGAKIAEAIYKNDLIEGQMGAFTKSGVRERTLESNPEGLLFGTGYDLSEMQERIDQAKQNLAEQFPEGRNTPPMEEFGETVEDVQKEYDRQVKEIERLTNEMVSLSKQVNATGGYLSMYENAKAANASLAIPNTVNDRLFELGQGNTIGNIIHDEYSQKVKPTNTEITAKTIEDEVVEGYKNAISKISSSESMQNVPLLQEVLSDKERSKVEENIANINKQYNEMRENIKNTPIDIKSTGASFDAAQIEQYKSGLDELIVEGNKLREIMVYNFNQVNSSELSGIDDISVKWQDFVNKATSEKRLKITDDESVDKMMLIDNIMKDIKRQASEFDILPNTEAKIQNTILGRAQFVKEQVQDFGKSDKQFIVNDVEIQRLKIVLDLLKQLRESTNNVRSEDYSPEKTKTIDKLTENITDRINKLKKSNEKINEKAKELGIKIEEAPQIKYSNKVGTTFNEYIDKYIGNLRFLEKQNNEFNKSEANKKTDETYKQKALKEEDKRHKQVIENINKEEQAYRSIFKIADSDYRGKQVAQAKAEADAAKAQAAATNNYINKKNEEAKTIDVIKSKLNEYNQQLAHTDTTGLDKVINKLNIYNRELDKAIQNNDIARAQNIFSLYQDTFGSIGGIQKGQQMAANEEAKRQAELAREQAAAQKQAAQEAAQAAKTQATNRDNYINKKNEEAKTIDDIKSKMYEYNQQLAHTDTTGLDKVIEKLGIYSRELDKAIQKNDVARASNIFGLYENKFGSIAGIQKGQQMAANEEAKRQAELAREQAAAQKQAAQEAAQAARERAQAEADAAREQAKAQADAAKAQAEAQKQWEEQVNKLKNKVSEVTNYIKQAVANTVKVIRAANNVVNKSISVMIGAFDKLGSAVQRIIQLFGNFGNRVTGFNKQGNILKGTFTELKSKVDLLVGAFNKLYNNSFINEGKKLLSSVQTLNMLIGTELTTQTMEWATNLEHAFGLSAAGLISDLKELTAVMYGLGMTSQDVQVAATNLEAVAMSLSATTGYDFSTVVNKIQSGMKGMTQSIDDLGLSVRESQMDAFLKKLKAQGGEYANIGTSFSQLEEQQRIYVRYAAIMDQFTSKDAYSAENYAKSLRTITGSLSILNSQLRGLKSDIGSLALQLFAKIIQPLIYIIYLVRQAVAGLANLLGIDITLNPKINNSEDVVAPIEDVTDALDKEADAADKAKGSLDSLDHVSTMSESKNSKKGDDFDYSSLMNISDDYAKLLEDLGKMQDDFIEECKEKFWKMVNDIKDKFTAWIKRITGRIIDWDAIKANWEIIKENLQKTWDNIVRIFKAGTDIIGGLLYSIFDDLDGTTLLAKLSEILEKFTRLIALILERVQPKIQAFYDKYVSKYVVAAGDKIEEILDKIIAKLDEFIKWWENPGSEEAINKWFDDLGKHFEELMLIFKVLFKGDKSLTGDDNNNIKNMGLGMKSVYDIALSLHNIFESLKEIITDVAKRFLDFDKDNELTKDDANIGIKKVLDTLSEKLKELETWISNNKENISKILSEVIETVGALAEAKFEIVTKVIDLIVQNADTIVKILDKLQKLIEWAAEHPTLAIGLSIGGQAVLGIGKSAFTAWIWKTILGLGPGGAAATAGAAGGATIGGKILAGIKGAITGSKLGALFTAENLAGAGAVASTLGATVGVGLGSALGITTGIEGIKEGLNDIIDGVTDSSNAFDNWLRKLQGLEPELKFSSDNYKTFAYEVRKALEDTYGQDIDTSKAQRAFKVYAEQMQLTYNLTDEETEALAKNIERQYGRIGGSVDGIKDKLYMVDGSERNIDLLSGAFKTLDGTVDETSKSVDEDMNTMSTSISDSVNAAKKPMDDLSYKCQQVRYSLKYTFRSLAEEIRQIAANLSSRIGTLFSQVGVVARQTESLRQASQRTVQQSSGWNPVKLKGFASGGIPNTGSLFLANENGNAELVGNFGGYTGVANQDMIIKAMQNAMVQAIKSAGGFGQSGSVVNNFNIGTMIGDDSSYRQLARKLNTINERSNSNIANVGFVMS